MSNVITIGQIIKPQGLKGLVKVKAITDDPQRFKRLKAVYVDTVHTPIEQVSFMGDFVVLKLQGVNDRNTAENLRGRLLSINKADAIDPGEGYFIADLIGAHVLDDSGKILGTILDINSFGSADVVECKYIDDSKNEKRFRFPHLKHLVKNVDIAAKTFTVFSDYFVGVVVYDD